MSERDRVRGGGAHRHICVHMHIQGAIHMFAPPGNRAGLGLIFLKVTGLGPEPG